MDKFLSDLIAGSLENFRNVVDTRQYYYSVDELGQLKSDADNFSYTTPLPTNIVSEYQ